MNSDEVLKNPDRSERINLITAEVRKQVAETMPGWPAPVIARVLFNVMRRLMTADDVTIEDRARFADKLDDLINRLRAH